jgi:hypothetical protein
MMPTVCCAPKTHTNDWSEVTDDTNCSEVRGRDLRVTNKEVEKGEGEFLRVLGTGALRALTTRGYESREGVRRTFGALQEFESLL